MLRATRPRDEVLPDRRRELDTSGSLEGLLAVALCATVLLACTAFLRRSSALSRTLADLQDESLRGPRAQPRPRGWLRATGARPGLVILISLDGLRADRLGLLGYARETAPNLRRLGAEAVVFRNACAQASQPLSSLKSLLTGKYPSTLLLQETGADLIELTAVQSPREYLIDALSAVEGALAQGFRAHGYRTAGLADGPWVNRHCGFQRGFEAFDESGGGLAAIVPRALAWLEANAAAPAFLFLQAADLQHPYRTHTALGGSFCATHQAHAVPATFSEPGGDASAEDEPGALSDHYDGSVLDLDAQLGAFLEELRLRGLYDRALIVVTSEHGESLGERGHFGHGGLRLEELLVPLVLKFPRDWSLRPARIEDPVELVDLLPTLFSLCGIPAQADVDGRSLLPLILHGVRGRDCLMAETTLGEDGELESSAALRTLIRPGRWQIVQDAARQSATFFALQRDPSGLEPHAVSQQELPGFLEVLVSRSRKPARILARPSAPPALAPELQQALVELGYGDDSGTLAGEERAATLR